MNNISPYTMYINENELGLYPVMKSYPYKVEDNIATVEQDILYVSQHSVQYWANNIENNKKYIAGHNAREMEKGSIQNLCNVLHKKDQTNIRWISLGAGAGYHDLEIYKIFNQSKIEVKEYIAVDFSINMLLTLLEVFKDSGHIPEADNNKIKAIKTNFHKLSEDNKILNILEGNNSDIECSTIFTIFGKTFGNSDENLLLEELEKIMKKDDYLFIGAKLECEDCLMQDNEKKLLTNFFNLSLKYLRHTMNHEELKKLPLKNIIHRDRSINMEMAYTTDATGGKSIWIPYIGTKITDDDIKKIKVTTETAAAAIDIFTASGGIVKASEKAVQKTVENLSNGKTKINTLVFGKSTEYKPIYFQTILMNGKLKYMQDISKMDKSYICAVYKKIKK